MARPHGQLERALTELTVGVAQGERRRRGALADTYTGEYQQLLQVDLSGNATADWAYVDQPVAWEMPFLFAPLQRRVPFQTPQFTHGIEMTGGTASLVVINAHVVGWNVTDQGWYVGATVRFAAAAPNAGSADPPAAYEAVAHLVFTGYATTPEVS